MRRYLYGSVLFLALLIPSLSRAQECGLPTTAGPTPKASDALYVLRAAVHLEQCELCVCDIDRDGTTLTRDALAVLIWAVGGSSDHNCVGCAVTQTIGAAGGAITSADGKLTLTIPAGALAADTEIGIEGIAIANLSAGMSSATNADGYEFSPEGLTFAVPATLTAQIDENPAGSQGDMETTVAILFSESGGDVDPLDDVAIESDYDSGTTQVSASVEHFSRVVTARVDGFRVRVRGVPEVWEVGPPRNVTASFNQHGVNYVEYTDQVFFAFEPTGGPITLAELIDEFGEPTPKTFEYKCTQAAHTSWNAIVKIINPTTDWRQSVFGPTTTGQKSSTGVDLFMSKQVTCADPLPPRIIELPGCTKPEGLNLGVLQFLLGCSAFNQDRMVSIACKEGAIGMGLYDWILAYSILSSVVSEAIEVMVMPDYSGEEEHLLFAAGSTGYFGTVYQQDVCAFTDFGFPDFGNSNWTDAHPYGAMDLSPSGFIATNNSVSVVDTWDWDPAGYYWGPTRRIGFNATYGLPGRLVSSWTPAAMSPIVSVLEADDDGDGSLLFHANTNADAAPTTVGAVQKNPRRVRCSLPICAVSNYGSNSLTVFTWDGTNSPVIVGNVPVGMGPVGIDVAPSSAGFAIVSTGLLDDSYWVTEVASDGSLISNTGNPVPAECSGPGHAIWLSEVGNALISCHDSDNLAEIFGVLP